MTAARGQHAWAGKQRSGGDIVTFLAGSAGVGRATLLSNLAVLLARRVPVHVCASPLPDRVRAAAADHAAGLALDAYSPPPGLAPLPVDGVAQHRGLLLIDGGAGLHANATTLALAGDLLILVTTPAPAAVADTFGLLKYVCTAGFVGRAALVINAAESPVAARQLAARFARAARRFLGRSLGLLGQIPRDPHVVEAAAHDALVVTRFPLCPASQALESICARLKPPRSSLARSCGVWSRVAGLFL